MGNFNSTSCNITGSGTTATCSVSYTPTAFGTGTHTIFGTYGGDMKHMSSSGNTAITVTSSSVGGEVILPNKLGLLAYLVVFSCLPIGAIGLVAFLIYRIRAQHGKIRRE